MAVKGIRHTGIVVSDMAKSLEFYRDFLGLEVWADFEDNTDYVQAITDVPGAHLRMVKLKSPEGCSVELLQYLSHPQEVPEPRKAYDVGCNHVSLQVDDIDGLYEKLTKHGIRFHAPPMLSTSGGSKTTYCRDPEGVIVELVEILPRDNSRQGQPTRA